MPTIVPAIELASERLAMRPYRAEDAHLLYAAAIESRETVGRWMPWCHERYADSDSANWVERCAASWQSGDAYSFAMFDRSGQFVGGTGINHINRVHSLANLGYWIRQSRQREGCAVDAVNLTAAFAFETLGLMRIEIVAAADNAGSRRVAEKAGALFECLARNRLLIRGKPVTAAVYSLIPKRDDPSPVDARDASVRIAVAS
jgi:ribosomal-protein-serine acetyltransferase